MTDFQTQAIIQLVDSLRLSALALRQRRGIILSGDSTWGVDCAKQIANHLSHSKGLWITSQAPEGVDSLSNSAALKCLGSETDLLVYDAHSGFDADSFAATSGLIRAGGLLLLLTPPLTEWSRMPDPEAERFFKSDGHHSLFLERFISIARQSEALIMIGQDGELPALPDFDSVPVSSALLSGPCRTPDQARAVATVIETATDKTNCPAVLISDRGRGKSAALGIAAAQLLQLGYMHILVTGPRLSATEAVFQHAAALLPAASRQRGLIELNSARLEYIAPDELIEARPEADLLLVDEAAAIPLPMLTALLALYAHIVFATTVHGYEGTGRGFGLRFYKVLDQQTPGWQQIRLQQPIRWAVNDPLEQFVFDALLLNATMATDEALGLIDPASCQAEAIHHEQLVQDEALLSQVFGLLVLAHYRTRPNDLRQLLDNPGLQLYVMRQRQHIVGVTLLIAEGGIEEKLAQQIYQGRRRLQGHLLPQSLASHAGMIGAPGLNYLRIMRIAIHPALQGQGLGSKLIRHVIENIDQQDYDCIGISFGVTPELLHFWQHLGFKAVRLGVMREHSSGTHSLIMLRPLSAAGQQLTQQAEQHMQLQLPLLLSDALRGFDPELARLLLQPSQPENPELSMTDWQDAISFAYGARGYEFCIAAITKLTNMAAADQMLMACLSEKQQELLKRRVMQQQSWTDAVAQTQLSGRAEAIALLRESIQLLIKHYCPQKNRDAIKKLIDL